MAALDFPQSPTVGEQFSANGRTWEWNGLSWRFIPDSGGGGGSDGFTFIQDTVPTATAAGQTWFDTSTSTAFVWVVDADSAQWVQYAPGSGGSGGGGGEPQDADGVSLQHSTGVPVATSTWTALNWDIEVFDTLGMHAGVNAEINIVEAGRYLVNYRFSFAASAGGTQRLGRIAKNGSAFSFIGLDMAWPSPTIEGMVSGTAVLDLEAGDFLWCVAFQDSGATLAVQGIDAAQGLCYFEAVKLTTGGGGGAGSDGFTFTQDTEPTATGNGQTWFNTATGDAFVWIVDVDSSQWVQYAPGAGSGGGGEPPTQKTVFGTAVVTTDVAGWASFAFGETFGSPPIVICQNGDNAAGPAWVCSTRVTTPTVYGMQLFRLDNGAPLASATTRVNWIAVGAV